MERAWKLERVGKSELPASLSWIIAVASPKAAPCLGPGPSTPSLRIVPRHLCQGACESPHQSRHCPSHSQAALEPLTGLQGSVTWFVPIAPHLSSVFACSLSLSHSSAGLQPPCRSWNCQAHSHLRAFAPTLVAATRHWLPYLIRSLLNCHL